MNYTIDYTQLNEPLECVVAYDYSNVIVLISVILIASGILYFYFTPKITEIYKDKPTLKYSFKYIVFTILLFSIALFLNVIFNF